jgi:putative transposase
MKYYHVSIAAYCLMPSHLHAIINLENIMDLSAIVGSFKSLSSRRMKSQFPEAFKDWPGSEESFHLWKIRFDDFIIRDLEQFQVKMNYIHKNPVRAKLVEKATDWKYSSAGDWLLDIKGVIEIDKGVIAG